MLADSREQGKGQSVRMAPPPEGIKMNEKKKKEIDGLNFDFTVAIVVDRVNIDDAAQLLAGIQEAGYRIVYKRMSPGHLWICDREPRSCDKDCHCQREPIVPNGGV
jgi:hypothetical protein